MPIAFAAIFADVIALAAICIVSILPLTNSLESTEFAASSDEPTAPAAISLEPTWFAAIKADVIAFAAISLVPTWSAPILADVTEFAAK